ncbi:MAG: sterol-binding protein, partial [Aquificota bacterium]
MRKLYLLLLSVGGMAMSMPVFMDGEYAKAL